MEKEDKGYIKLERERNQIDAKLQCLRFAREIMRVESSKGAKKSPSHQILEIAKDLYNWVIGEKVR